jgi:hypothetical protein
MVRRCTLLIAALLVVSFMATWGTAQYHDDKYITCGTVLQLVDATLGTASTIFDNNGTAYDMAMDVDNRSLWFGQTGGLYKVDLLTLAVTTMIQDAVLSSPRDMVLNEDGDLMVTTTIALYKYSGGKITTVATAPSTATNWYGGMEIDIDTGKYVLQSKNSPYPLISIDDKGVITTLGTGGNPRYSIVQDLRTGDWYQGSFTALYVLKQGTSSFAAVTQTGASPYWYAMAIDRASAANPRILSIHNNGGSTSKLNYIDLGSYAVTLTTLNFGIYNYETEIYRSKNLCSVNVGSRQWAFLMSFPGEVGKGYVIALSLSGVRPGINLPDGRRINLAFDVLSYLTLSNLIPTIFNPGPGVLNANGEAKAVLDVSGLPPLGGLRVWAEALVLDKGVMGPIADPVGLTVP